MNESNQNFFFEKKQKKRARTNWGGFQKEAHFWTIFYQHDVKPKI
jgi:hypothetical protein